MAGRQPLATMCGRAAGWLRALALLLCLAATPAIAEDAGVTLRTRAWDHGPFGRMVFDIPRGIDAEAAIGGGRLTIRFGAAVIVDLPLVNRRLKQWIEPGRYDPGTRTLSFPLRVPADLGVDWIGRSLVVDLRKAADPPPAPPAQAATEPAAPAATAVPETPPKAAVEEAPPAGSFVEQPAAAAIPADDKPPVQTTTADDPAEAAADTAVPPAPARPVDPAHPVDPAGPGAVVSARIMLGGTRLMVTFPRPAAAAVFARGDALWLVFNQPVPVDLAAADSAVLQRLGTIETVPVDGGVALRLAGRPMLPAVTRTEGGWQFDFAAAGVAPARPLAGRVRSTAEGERVMVYEMTGATAPLEIPDPAVGDHILAVPAALPGAGVASPAVLPDFDLLSSAVGLAIVPQADGIAVVSGPEEVVVRAADRSLILSMANGGQTPGRDGGETVAALDVARWARSPEVRAELQRMAALAPDGARPAAALDLACAWVAAGLAAEALGQAALILEKDPAAEDNPVFRQMRGIAAAMMGRPESALSDLGIPALEFSPDAALWRGSALATAGRLREAGEPLARGEVAVDQYPPRQRDRLRAAMVEAALAADDLPRAAGAAAQFKAKAATPAGQAAALALAGRVAQRQGDGAAARAAFAAALETGDTAARVDAELGMIDLGLADGSVTRATAIERLDRLRFAWRGDSKELQVLKRLGDLQLADGRWRDGLDTLRSAQKLFPDAADTGDLIAAQRAAFQRLFLGGAADALPPVQAVALYFDYRDLTPLGRDGDEMIRRLADRLTDVDLLDQAKALLQHQVDYRLTGIAQAQVAARLALLHLIDREPAEALAVLDRTEQPRLPDRLAAQRRLMRAKALSVAGKLDEARALLAGDTSADGLRLAAEIAWNHRDWPAAAASLDALVSGDKAAGAEPLAPDTAALILRQAAALALAGDADGVAALGRRFGAAMAKTALADAFAGLTDNTASSPQQMRNLAQTLANGNGLGRFVDTLETRLRERPLSTIN